MAAGVITIRRGLGKGAYDPFKQEPLLDDFGLELREVSNLFGAIASREPSEILKTQLREKVDLAVAISTEKARSDTKSAFIDLIS